MRQVITVLGEHGETQRQYHFDGEHADRDAALRYCAIVLNSPKVHVTWTEGDTLPGLPEKKHAERFGDPCEKPCCVPLADPWPEQQPSQTVKDPSGEMRER